MLSFGVCFLPHKAKVESNRHLCFRFRQGASRLAEEMPELPSSQSSLPFRNVGYH